jgi:hypothetical protein
MRYNEIKPQKAADITKITPQQLAVQQSQALPVKSDRQLRGNVRRQMAVDIAQHSQNVIQPSNFDKAMAFRQFCLTKNAANRDAEQQQRKAEQWIQNGTERRSRR